MTVTDISFPGLTSGNDTTMQNSTKDDKTLYEAIRLIEAEIDWQKNTRGSAAYIGGLQKAADLLKRARD